MRELTGKGVISLRELTGINSFFGYFRYKKGKLPRRILVSIGFPQRHFAGPSFQPQNFSFPSYGFGGAQSSAPPPAFGGIHQFGGLQQLLGQLLQALTVMSQGWGGFAGGGGIGGGFPQPNQNPAGSLARPSDPQDFASYLQAQRLGGSLEGKTGIAQRDAIPGTRFGRLQDPHLWDVGVARNYVFQFAAYASDNNALTPQGMQAGAQAFQNMTPDAKLFMQVASVFKGDINGGPGFYDNPGLANLLRSKGQGDLLGPGVGETDVQTIGAVTKAINRGALSLNDVIQSGTIDNMPRYQQIIQYVSSGGFANDVFRYDSTPF